MELSLIESAVEGRGLALRGAFSVTPEDAVPPAADGRGSRTLVLVGNAGPEMFRRFAAEREPARDLLDEWSAEVVTALADTLGGWALFPFQRPHLPFIRWARKAEPWTPLPSGS
jgi:hypothetical protein